MVASGKSGQRLTTHDAGEDERNRSILIYVDGDLLPRDEAKVSVYDSGFLLGDGMWEGLRLYNGKWAFLLGGRNSEDQPRLDEMVNALETATALDPDLTRAHYNLALLYERLGRSGAAETRMARAAELDSTNVDYRFAAAQLALSHGKRDVARPWLAAALELGPGDPRGADLRARIDGVGGR